MPRFGMVIDWEKVHAAGSFNAAGSLLHYNKSNISRNFTRCYPGLTVKEWYASEYRPPLKGVWAVNEKKTSKPKTKVAKEAPTPEAEEQDEQPDHGERPAASGNWADNLPSACDIYQIWSTNEPVENGYLLCQMTPEAFRARCRRLCKTTPEHCRKLWFMTSQVLVKKKQLDAALDGHPGFLMDFVRRYIKEAAPDDDIPREMVLSLHPDIEQYEEERKSLIARIQQLEQKIAEKAQ